MPGYWLCKGGCRQTWLCFPESNVKFKGRLLEYSMPVIGRLQSCLQHKTYLYRRGYLASALNSMQTKLHGSEGLPSARVVRPNVMSEIERKCVD